MDKEIFFLKFYFPEYIFFESAGQAHSHANLRAVQGEGVVASADILAISSAFPPKEVQAPIVRRWTTRSGAQ